MKETFLFSLEFCELKDKDYLCDEIRFYVVANNLNDAISKGNKYFKEMCLPKLLLKAKKERKEDKNAEVADYKNYTLTKIELEKETVVF